MTPPPPTIQRRATSLTYLLTFAYNVALGMSLVLVPLYGLELGYNLGELGIIVASQAVFGLALRFFGGTVADHFGERRVLLFSFGFMTFGGVVFTTSGAFAVLLAGQLCMGLSRSVFWTAAQSYATRIDEAQAGPILGRFMSASNAGAVLGAFLGGTLATALGYVGSFFVMAGSAAVGLVAVAMLPSLPRKSGPRTLRDSLGPLPRILKRRAIILSGVASFGAAATAVLADILNTPYFESLGYGTTLTGGMRSLFAIGTVLVGIVFGVTVARMGQRAVFALGFLGFGATVAAIPAASQLAWLAGLVVLATGVASGLLQAVYALIASEHSAPEERGTALAVSGTWWSSAFLVIPAGVGALASRIGLEPTFWAASGVFVAVGALTPLLYRWLLPGNAEP